MAARKSAINLLPKSEFDLSFWGRFLKWSLSSGRYIIILTELVVIIAFMSRFKLDKDLLDLGDRIDGKKAILDATYSTEVNFRSVQSRLSLSHNLLTNNIQITPMWDQVTGSVPEGVVLESVTTDVAKHEVAIAAQTSSRQALSEFVTRIANNNFWKSVDMTSLTADSVDSIKFSLLAKF